MTHGRATTLIDGRDAGQMALRNARRGRGAIVGAARLSTVPLACAASFALDDGALRDGAFVVVAVVAQLYALGVWALMRRGATRLRRVLPISDVVFVLALAVAADPDRSVAAQFPLLVMFVVWALLLDPRQLVLRGVGVVVVLAGVDLLDAEPADEIRLVVFVAVSLFVSAVVARRVAERLGTHAALARRAAELEADMDDLQRRERVRIAQLLHDDALQRLLAARQDLDDARVDPEAMRRVEEGLLEASRAMRNLTLVVHDDALEAAGVDAAVQRIVDEAAARSGFAAWAAVDPALDAATGAVILPMLRELVANVERHADADTLGVEVRQQPAGVTLTVTDDGNGLAAGTLAEAARAGHLGHVGLRRRVEDLRGRLDVDSAPGRGCRVTIELRDSAIRARRELESALQREREWNAALVAGFPDPFIVISDETRIVDVSDRFLAVTGWTRAELLAAPPGRFPHIPPEQAEQKEHEIVARAVDDDHTVESELYCRDGRRVAVIVSVRRVLDPRGGRGLRLVTFKDISERRAAEHELRTERDLSTAIRRAMQEPFLQTLDGVVIAVNRAFCELTGFREDELVGARRPYFFIRTATLDDAFAYARRLDEEGEASTRLLALRADGREVEIEVRGVTVRDPDGVSIGRVQTARLLEPSPPLGPRVPGIVPED